MIDISRERVHTLPAAQLLAEINNFQEKIRQLADFLQQPEKLPALLQPIDTEVNSIINVIAQVRKLTRPDMTKSRSCEFAVAHTEANRRSMEIKLTVTTDGMLLLQLKLKHIETTFSSANQQHWLNTGTGDTITQFFMKLVINGTITSQELLGYRFDTLTDQVLEIFKPELIQCATGMLHLISQLEDETNNFNNT